MEKSQIPTFLASRSPISTGVDVLDELTLGGFPQSYSIVLSSPSCDQRDLVIQRFLEEGVGDEKITLCLAADVTRYLELVFSHPKSFHVILCSPQAYELLPALSNVSETKGVQNLTEINITLMKIVDSFDSMELREKRAYIDVLSDVLLHHGRSTARRWISELAPRLKTRGFTVFGMIDPLMHKKEETEAVTSTFDGEVEIFDREVQGKSQKFIVVRRFYDREHSDQERII